MRKQEYVRMFDPQNISMVTQVAERFRALGDENRLRILARLDRAPANVTALSTELGIKQASVSKHLALLRQAGLVNFDRQGAQAVYRITDRTVKNLCQLVCQGVLDHVRQQHAALEK